MRWMQVFGISAVVGLLVALTVALLPFISSWWESQPIPVLVGVIFFVWLSGRVLTRRKPRIASGLSRTEWRRLLALFVIALFWIVFWMGFEQAGDTMNLFAFNKTDRDLGTWEIPASYFQAINPLLILILAPLFTMFWGWMDRSRYALSASAKQGVGMMILGLGFVVLSIADAKAGSDGMVAPWWLLAVYFLHTAGELCLSPIGLSMVSKLAPERFASLIMGVWFTTLAIASYLAGMLESVLAGSGIPLYWFLVGTSVGMGFLLLMLSPVVNRLICEKSMRMPGG